MNFHQLSAAGLLTMQMQYNQIYTMFHKQGRLIFDYNFRISWSVFIILAPVERGMNTPQHHVIYLLNC